MATVVRTVPARLTRISAGKVKPSRLAGLKGRDPREWFRDWDRLDSTYTAYAGRDVERHPIRERNLANEVLVVDDNELADTDSHPEPNHSYKTIALLGDGTTREYDVRTLREKGVIPDTKYLIPGPGCPVEELRVVSRDAPAPKR